MGRSSSEQSGSEFVELRRVRGGNANRRRSSFVDGRVVPRGVTRSGSTLLSCLCIGSWLVFPGCASAKGRGDAEQPVPALPSVAAKSEATASPGKERASLASAQESDPYFSKFGDQVLRRTQYIVKARVVSVEQATAQAVLVEVQVDTTFKGEEHEGFTILANRGEYFEGSELLLFLNDFEDGPRTTCSNRISVSDGDYDAKERHLTEQLEIEALSTPEDRRRKSRELLLQNLRAEGKWTRWNALRGLAYVLETYPDMMREADRKELREIAESTVDVEFQQELQALLEDRR